MITIAATRKLFFDRVNSKLSPELLLPEYPSVLLDNTIVECLSTKVNNGSLFEYLGADRFLNYVYFAWIDRYKLYLGVNTNRINFEMENIDAKAIQGRKQQFEELFSKINALGIFHPVSL